MKSYAEAWCLALRPPALPVGARAVWLHLHREIPNLAHLRLLINPEEVLIQDWDVPSLWSNFVKYSRISSFGISTPFRLALSPFLRVASQGEPCR